MPKLPINTVFIKNTGSTNELAKKLLKEHKNQLPFVVQTNYQTQGKGQYQKSWESLPGENLLFSLVIKAPKIVIEQQFDISKAISVSIREVLSKLTNAKVCIKWPNDIYVGNDKIAGVLIENTIVGQKLDNCIIGIGLNVNQTVFSSNLPNPTSLKLLRQKAFDLDKLKKDIIDEIFLNLQDINSIDKVYKRFLYRKGELEQFSNSKGENFYGVIQGTDNIGRLLVRTENNTIKSFSNNEIRFILRNSL